jgi:hypothetical protein
MSGKARTRTVYRTEPFDFDRVASGEALVSVTLPDGRCVVGTLFMDDMFVPTGEVVTVRAGEEAIRRRESEHARRILRAGMLAEAGSTKPEIAAQMVSEGDLSEPVSDQSAGNNLRTVKRWLKGFDDWLGLRRPKG